MLLETYLESRLGAALATDRGMRRGVQSSKTNSAGPLAAVAVGLELP